MEPTSLQNFGTLVSVITKQLELANRKTPLLWFDERFDRYSDKSEFIIQWMKGKGKYSDTDLITTIECMAGIEANVIIGIGEETMDHVLSRCKGQFVHIL